MKIGWSSRFYNKHQNRNFFGLIVIRLFNYDSFIEKRIFIKI